MEQKLNSKQAQSALQQFASPEAAKVLQRFFKTGPGEYGEGDRFRGVKVPQIRKVAQKFHGLSHKEVSLLLKSEFHEDRLLALVILTNSFKKSDDSSQKRIFDLYVKSFPRINNWDLVDASAPSLSGAFLWKRDRKILYRWARSRNLWVRRIAVLSTFHFIRHSEFQDALSICELLLKDREILIHKATGWMLREIGKRDLAALRTFLDRCGSEMPRTMLRYAIERLPNREKARRLQQTRQK